MKEISTDSRSKIVRNDEEINLSCRKQNFLPCKNACARNNRKLKIIEFKAKICKVMRKMSKISPFAFVWR